MDKTKEKKDRKLTYATDFKTSENGKGLSKHYLYYVWLAMKKRCYDVNDVSYPNYGAIGIDVCDVWKNDVTAFFNWSIKNGYSKGLSLDRIDNSKGYCPENCRYVSRFVQQRNRRENKLFLYNGEEKTLPEWAAILDISYSKLYSRITVQKMSFEEAINAYMFTQEKFLNLEESLKFGAKVKEIVKSQGRKYIWLIDECAGLGVELTSASLSHKISGKECFTKSERDAIYDVLSLWETKN